MKAYRIKSFQTLIVVGYLCGSPYVADGQSQATAPHAAGPTRNTPPGMVWVPGGEFTMGWDGPEARFDEKPAHRVRVDGYWIDETEVTNAQFRAFVEATGYVTTAERPVNWEEIKKQLPPGTPKPADEVLQPGSLVFTPPDHAVDLRDFSQWWTWTHGANWCHPQGPRSSIVGNDDHPVVHVSWEDAAAYAKWAGKRLPTEAEWEHAARYGQDEHRYTWGSKLSPDGKHMANIWQGTFPHDNTNGDGFVGAAPVKSFPPNALGLYDMAGNVWEWTADKFMQPGQGHTGWGAINTASIGLQAGVQGFRMIIVLQDRQTLDEFKANKWTGSVGAVAVAGEAGGARVLSFTQGMAVYTGANKGLMAGVHIGLEYIRY